MHDSTFAAYDNLRYAVLMRLSHLIEQLETIAPLSLAEPWDKVGLHVGRQDANIRRGLLCIDLTEPVLDEAIKKKVNLIIAYHPPVFKPLEAVTDGDVKQRIVLRAIENKIAIYSPHTALDAAQGGVNDWLASGLGEGKVKPIRADKGEKAYELVTFVPEKNADKLRTVLAENGAGVIGNYSKCTFNVEGEGTFQGDQTTNPAIGRRGAFERVKEIRMEMLVSGAKLKQAIAALCEYHPYEEPAYYIFPLNNDDGMSEQGQGRIVTLDRAVALSTVAQRIKKRLKVKHLNVAPAGKGNIKRIGLCAGAGGSLLEEAGNIDLFFTGEMRHHDILGAVAQGTSIILAGHTQTERPYLPTYKKCLQRAGLGEIEWTISKLDKAPDKILSI